MSTKNEKAITQAMSRYTPQNLANKVKEFKESCVTAAVEETKTANTLFIVFAKARREELHLASGYTKFEEFCLNVLGAPLADKLLSKQSASAKADAGEALLLMPELQKTATGQNALSRIGAFLKNPDYSDEERESFKADIDSVVKEFGAVTQSVAADIVKAHKPASERVEKTYDYYHASGNPVVFNPNDFTSDEAPFINAIKPDTEVTVYKFDKIWTLVVWKVGVAVTNGEDVKELPAVVMLWRTEHTTPKTPKRAKQAVYNVDEIQDAIEYLNAHPDCGLTVAEILAKIR